MNPAQLVPTPPNGSVPQIYVRKALYDALLTEGEDAPAFVNEAVAEAIDEKLGVEVEA